MAIELSLDTVDQLAQEDYADIVIPLPSGGAATLVHPLRMEDEQRDKLTDYFKDLQEAAEAAEKDGAEEADEAEESDADMIEQAQDLLRIIVAGDPDDLFAALGRDATKYQTVVKFYFETVKPGEA